MIQGRTFGDFIVKERLGRGGGGEVYRAEQPALGREAVIKVMLGGAASTEASDRFLREARLASQLDHPFAAHVYGFGAEPDGLLWIAMELVRGQSLDAVIKAQGPMPLQRFVPFFERLCEVLHAAHEQGIVHRDIKPANVMVISRAGRLLPKLLDLGIARRRNDLEPNIEPEGGEVPTTHTIDAGTTSTTLAAKLVGAETIELTQIGAVVGTPAYMAPEQWADASSVSASADIYSLSVLAYQVLTGKVPFAANKLTQVARAHATAPLPALTPDLPEGLYDVLAKGAAKTATARYSSAIELGAAVRAASLIGGEPFTLLQLDEGVRENALAHAPQPIADAVTLLDGARTPKQQLEAIYVVRRVAIRYLASIALACRARVGPGASSDSPSVAAALKKLAGDRLTEDEWCVLTQDLVVAFGHRRSAYPVPELIAFFFDFDGSVGPGGRALATLSHISLPEKNASDEAVQETLQKLVPALADLLRALAFVFDYSLTVRTDTPERWMGARRLRRSAQPVSANSLPATGLPFLVDSVEHPVLTLWPFLQVFSPGGGLPDELFFLDGSGRHGARLVALPAAFERQSEEVWPWLSANITDVGDTQAGTDRTEKPPYKGLATFTADDADSYFGREKEAEAFANRLRLSPLLAVVGPSGSGKSSFVLAGVLPLLAKGWRAVVTRPGATPLQALAARLGAAGFQLDSVTAESLIEGLAEHESLLLVVDQFEETVTLCQDDDARQAFAQLLVNLAASPSSRLRVVLTLRDDFLIQIQQLKALRERLSMSLQLLSTPARDELIRVVTEPARRAGYTFDDQALPLKMVSEVAQYPGALALLSFTASQLWEMRDRQLHQMRAKTYDALGGVGGALGQHAESTLAKLSPEEAKLVREAFRHLVTSQMTRAVLSRKEVFEVLGSSPAAASVLETLVNARLLVTQEDSSGDDRVEIIHEALIVSWPRLAVWLREDAETARMRDALRASAKQWAERGRPSGLLWRKETLAEYRVWRARFAGRLTQDEAAFANASLREEARARLVRRALAAVAFVTLAIGLVVVFRAYRLANASAIEAKHNADESQQRLADLRVEQARLAALDDRPFHTLLFAEEARRLGAKGTTIDYLEGRATTKLRGQVASRGLGDEGSLLFVAPDETALVALGTSGTFRALTLPALDVITELHRGGEEQSFAFMPTGHAGFLCTSTTVSFVELGKSPTALATVPGGIRHCTVNRQGTQLGLLETGGTAHFWRIGPGGRLDHERTLALRTEVGQLVFADDGKTAVAIHGIYGSYGNDDFCPLIDPLRAQVISRLPTGKERVVSATFSHDSSKVVTGARDNVVRLFASRDGASLSTMRGHTDRVTDVQFAVDDRAVLSSSADGSARVWSLKGEIQASMVHRAAVMRAVFRQDQIVTTTSDGNVHRWLPGASAPVSTFYGHNSEVMGFAAVGAQLLLTSASDGMLRVWDFTKTAVKQVVTDQAIEYAIPSNDSKWIMTGPNERTFTRWAPDGRRLDTMKVTGCDTSYMMAFTAQEPPLVASREGNSVCLMQWAPEPTVRRLDGHTKIVRGLELSGDGRYLASGDADAKVIVWEIASGKALATLAHDTQLRGLTFSSDSKQLATAGADGTIHLWDWAASRELRSWKASGNGMMSLLFADRDRALLATSIDAQVALWSPETGELIKRFDGHTTVVTFAVLNAEQTLIASSDWFGNIYVWNREQGVALDRIQVGGVAYEVRWLNDGTLVVPNATHPSFNLYAPPGPSEVDWHCQSPLYWKDGQIVRRVGWPASCEQRAPSDTTRHPE